MASKIGDLFWEVDASTKKFDKELKGSEKKAKTTGSKLTKVGKTIATAFSVLAVAGVAALGKKVIEVALKFEDAFQIQEAAIIKLNAALEATGQNQEGVSESIQDFATELQGLTTVGDEATLSLIQIALNSGLTAEASKEAAKDAIGLSKAFGIDLTAAIKATTNAQQGNFDMLNRYVPAVKNAKGEVEKQAAAEIALANAFEIARAETKTSIGVEIQLQNAIGDSQEIIGEYVSEILTPWRAVLLDLVTQSNKLRVAQKKLRSGVDEETLSNEELILSYNAIIQKITALSIQAGLGNAINQAIAAGKIKALKEELLHVEALIDQQIVSNALKAKAADEAAEDADEQAAIDARALKAATIKENAAAILATIKEDALTASEKELNNLQEQINFWAQYRKTIEGAEEVFQLLAARRKELLTSEGEALKQNIEITQTATEVDAIWRQAQADASARNQEDLEAENQLYLDLANVGVGAVLSGISDIGEALVVQELGWDNFAKAGLNAIAAILDALSAQLVAQAASITASFFLGNITAPVGAGQALIGAGLASLSAGAVRGLAGSFEQGGIVPITPGIPATGDRSLVAVNGGERITPADEAGGTIELSIMLDGETIARSTIEDYVNKGRILVEARGLTG